MSLTRDAVVAALREVTDPESGADLISADIIRALNIDGGTVRFVVEGRDGAMTESARKAAVERLEALAGVEKVLAVATAPAAPKAAKGPPPELNIGRPKQQGPQKIPGVERIIAIASGKGGVGKSTVAGNLAVALAAEGRRVGMLDADVYGPSQPRILGVSGRPASPDGKIIMPLRNHGVTMMSIGLMTAEDEAVVWRGPMLMGALQQMMNQVRWGRLDVLIVDLPPGTGDVQMTLTQKFEVTGAVIVSTPQDLALLDARKALDMFAKMNTRIFGMIENMSTHICSNCGFEEHIFGHGGAQADAERLGLPFLGEIPLDIEIRKAADGGAPIVVSAPESRQALAFRAIARELIEAGAG
ncbi:Mrp/NBP35 family ATP-binding protein [Pikeienuella piscinae]|uniref:Iron-sulfur cluster carrier protein n=1 Tax=Pikeienuella piscinae TaxID=2748098 RepID=A0A7L5BTW7_9RHOB|nr:Mrp/NBP35 family ATP-binding protein [Pikeienuella piscinae]QIE55610.1 Mrp/NBP35 family ATP-binding protein [Pikeienuella piscinae]